MLQIFILCFIFFQPTMMIASNIASLQGKKQQCLTPALESSNIQTKKIYIQLDSVPIHAPQATLIKSSPIISVKAQRYIENPYEAHEYQPTACLHLFADSMRERMMHR